MSGGSYNYLFHADSGDIGNKTEELTDIIERLKGLGFSHVALSSQLILDNVKELDDMIDKIRNVWQAVEYCDSGDWGIEEIKDEVQKYLNKQTMYTKEFEFKNGDEVIEKITGFTGTITGTAFYLTGCTQHLITAKCEKEGKEPVALWYDEGRLEFIKNVVKPEDVQGKDNGCDLLPNIGMRGA